MVKEVGSAQVTSKNLFEVGLFSKVDIRKIVLPLIIEQALLLSAGMFDIMMVSFAGEKAVSGVSLVDTMNTLLIFLFTALATGGAIVVGQYIGNKNTRNSQKASKQLLIISLLLSFLFMMVCLILNEQLLSTIFGKIDSGVLSNAKIYLYVTALSFPFIAIYSSATGLFRSMGNTRIAMNTSLIVAVFDIFLNVLFIYIFKWGTFGAGFSTLISRMVAAIVIIVLLRKPSLPIAVRRYDFWRMDWSMMKTIFKISIPFSLESSSFQIGKIILTGLIVTFGTRAITANAVTGSLTNVATIPGQAFWLVITTVVAQCIGAREFEQAKLYTRSLLKMSTILMLGMNLILFVLLKPILSLYHLSPKTFDMSYNIMLIHIIGWVTVWVISFALPNSLRAAGDVKFPMMISAFSMFVFRIAFSYILAYGFGFGVYSIYLAMLMDWTFRFICFIFRFQSGKWKRFAIVQK
ncbi:MATE family efflux transporter [Bacilli bacterium]|nr:MATE family efflux transporter [Bacilli bacterium]